jgi:hypothetical protein
MQSDKPEQENHVNKSVDAGLQPQSLDDLRLIASSAGSIAKPEKFARTASLLPDLTVDEQTFEGTVDRDGQSKETWTALLAELGINSKPKFQLGRAPYPEIHIEEDMLATALHTAWKTVQFSIRDKGVSQSAADYINRTGNMTPLLELIDAVKQTDIVGHINEKLAKSDSPYRLKLDIETTGFLTNPPKIVENANLQLLRRDVNGEWRPVQSGQIFLREVEDSSTRRDL